MASTTVRTTALPRWAQGLRNWLTVGQYARLKCNTDTPETGIQYRLHARIESLGESLLSAIFGREPIGETDLAFARTVLLAAELRAEDRSLATIH